MDFVLPLCILLQYIGTVITRSQNPLWTQMKLKVMEQKEQFYNHHKFHNYEYDSIVRASALLILVCIWVMLMSLVIWHCTRCSCRYRKTPRYSWNTAKVDVKHQSISQFKSSDIWPLNLVINYLHGRYCECNLYISCKYVHVFIQYQPYICSSYQGKLPWLQ